MYHLDILFLTMFPTIKMSGLQYLQQHAEKWRSTLASLFFHIEKVSPASKMC